MIEAFTDIASVTGILRNPDARPGLPLDLEMRFRAHVDGDLRWSLQRWWIGDARPRRILPWIMLNPSRADARKNDPTLWRIIRFSWRWGFDGLLVVNLFPYRSPAPAELREWLKWHERGDWHIRDAIWANESHIAELLEPYDAAMAAWGAQPGMFGYEVDLAAERVLDKINESRTDRVLKLFCLGESSGRRPKHPMARGVHRVPDDVQPFPITNYPGSIVGLEKDHAHV